MAIPILGPIISSVAKPILGAIGKVAGPLVTGGIGYAGQAAANAANAREAQRNREFQAAEAEKARRFTDEQSSTAIQRRVEDLKAAGLNPALAYTGGADTGGSPIGAGSQAHFDSSAGAGINSAMGAFRFAQEVQDAQARRRAMNIDTAQKTLDFAYSDRLWKLRLAQSAADIGRIDAQTRRTLEQIAPEIALMRSQAGAHSARAALDRFEAARAKAYSDMYDTGFGRALPYMHSGAQVVGELLGNFNLSKAIFGKSAPRKVEHTHRRVN